MKKTMVLLAMTVLGFAFFYQNASHADTSQGVKTTQNQKSLSSKTNSTSLPWGNTGLTVNLDAAGTLHLPSGIVTNPPALYTIFGDVGSPGSKAVKSIEFDGPLFIYGSAAILFGMLPNVSNLSGLDNLNTTNVTNMDGMFESCQSFTSLDLSALDTSNVTSMYGMFGDMASLKSLNLNHFNTAKVTDMRIMFSACPSLTSLDLSSFNTSSVTTMSNIFIGCKSLNFVNLSSFNTQNVEDMSAMFAGCNSLNVLSLTNFNTSKLTNMSAMFADCQSLLALDLSSFNLSETTNIQGMLMDTPVLSILQLAPNSRIRTATALYQDTFGNTIASNRVFGGQENEPTYDTFNFLPKVIPGYTFQKASGKTSGTLTVAPQTVTFVYSKN